MSAKNRPKGGTKSQPSMYTRKAKPVAASATSASPGEKIKKTKNTSEQVVVPRNPSTQPITQVEIMPDAFRTIYVQEKLPEPTANVISKLFETPTFPKKAGTPQARIVALMKACKNIILRYGNPNYKTQRNPEPIGNKTTLTVDKSGEIRGRIDPLKINKGILTTLTFTQFMELFGKEEKDDEGSTEGTREGEEGDTSGERGWWNKRDYAGVKNFLNELVNTVINEIVFKKIQDPRTQAELIAGLWSIIMVKSISDISQCGELVNNLTHIKDKLPVETTHTGTIYDQINIQAKAAFVSSDKICAGVSSIILNKLKIPFETLCTRKSSRGAKTIQNVICQRADIAALAIIFTLFNKSNTERIGPIYIFKIIGESEDIIDLVKRLFTEYLFYNNELRGTTLQREYDDLYAKRRAEKTVSIYFDLRFSRLSAFISNIYDIVKEYTQLLTQIGKKLMSEKREFRCPLWTYYVSTDVFRLLYPYQAVDKDEISLGEITAATIDGTYGHDFHGIDCIKFLGEKFMDLFGMGRYKISTEETTANDEKNAIIKTLEMSDCITIDQQEDDLLYRFNNIDNFLVSETNNGFTRQWHFFDSLFSLQPLILSIDFTVGIQPYSSAFASEKGIAQERQSSPLLIRPTDPQSLQIMISDEIKKTGSGRELVGVCALYDGAAPYNIFPYFLTDASGKFQPYITKAIFDIASKPQQTTKKSRTRELQEPQEPETIELSFTTYSNLTPTELEDKYKDALIPTKIIPIDGIFQKLKEMEGMTPEKFRQIIDTLNDDKNEISNTFNDIWSLLLNFKEPKSKKTKIELNKADCESLLKGFNKFCKEREKAAAKGAASLTGAIQEEFCKKIRDILSGSKLSAEEFREIFDDIMMDIMIYITNPENADVSKRELLAMFNSGITNTITSKNNEIKMRLTYGRNVEVAITKTDSDRYKGLGLLMGLNRLGWDNGSTTVENVTRIGQAVLETSRTREFSSVRAPLRRIKTVGVVESTVIGPPMSVRLESPLRLENQQDTSTASASPILGVGRKRQRADDDRDTDETKWEDVEVQMEEDNSQTGFNASEQAGLTIGGKKHKYTKRAKKSINKKTRRKI